VQTKSDKLLRVRQSIGYKSALRFSQHIDLPYGTYISVEEISPNTVVSEVAECRLVKKLNKKELEIFLSKQFGSKLQAKVN
jgi:hypothetical protein